MNEPDLEPAINRLLMLTASAVTDEEAEAVEAQLAEFDQPAAVQPLIYVLVAQVTEKMPDGGMLALTDDGDMLAMGLIQAAETFGLDNLRGLVRDLPEPALPTIAVSLLAMWHSACAQAAERDLADLHVPDSPTTEGSR